MASVIPTSTVFDAQTSAGVHRALERYAHRRLHSAPEENLAIFQRNEDINERGLGRQTIAALRRYGYKPSQVVLNRADARPQHSDFGSFFRRMFSPQVGTPRGVDEPRTRNPRGRSRVVTPQAHDAPPRHRAVERQPRVVLRQPDEEPRRLPPAIHAGPRRIVVPSDKPRYSHPRVIPQGADVGKRRSGGDFPVPRNLPLGDPRIGQVSVRDTSQATAKRALAENLRLAGAEVVPGRRYAVFVDPMQRSPADFNGRVWVFEGQADGSVRRVNDFGASTQPTTYSNTLDSRYTDLYPQSYKWGPPTIDAGLYANISTERRRNFGGNIRIGSTPATRYGGHDTNRVNTETAYDILIHTQSVGSLGCLLVDDFKGFLAAVSGNPTFDVVIARYSR